MKERLLKRSTAVAAEDWRHRNLFIKRNIYIQIEHNVTMQELIKISKKEYEGMKETIEILQDEELMEQIKESEENLKKGVKFKKLDI